MQAAPELLQLRDRMREPALRVLERCRSVARTGKPRALELGGELRIESPPGGGTVVAARFPLR